MVKPNTFRLPAHLLDPEAIRQEQERRRCKAGCATFISQCIHIQDPDTEGTVIPFRLWPDQLTALAAIVSQRLSIILKARQLGLTWLCLAYALWRMVFTPGYTVVALSKNEEDAKKMAGRMEFMLRHAPDWLIRPRKRPPDNWRGPTWESTTEEVVIHHPPIWANGNQETQEDATFSTMPASANSGRSFTASLVLLDEWAYQQWAKEIWAAAFPAVNRPTGGQVIGLSSGKKGTQMEEIWLGALGNGITKVEPPGNGFVPIFLPWWADPRRDRAWHEATKRVLPNSHRSEYPATPADAFAVGKGAFFREWDDRVHVLQDYEPPKHWTRVGAYDAGFSSAACFKLYAISSDGWAVAYRELYMRRVTDPEQAALIAGLLEEERVRGVAPCQYIAADPSAWSAKSNTGESTAEILRRAGLPLRQADNSQPNGWRRLHQWLHPYPGSDGQLWAHLRFTPACQDTIRCYPACEEARTNPEEISNSSEHHGMDVDRYFVMSRPIPNISEVHGVVPGLVHHRPKPEDDDDDDRPRVRWRGM